MAVLIAMVLATYRPPVVCSNVTIFETDCTNTAPIKESMDDRELQCNPAEHVVKLVPSNGSVGDVWYACKRGNE